MTPRRWLSIRSWLRILQIVLLLPVTTIGSVCVRSGGLARVEFGTCACEEAGSDGGSPVFALAAGDVCGPCHDHALTAAGITRSHAPAAPPDVALQVGAFESFERRDGSTPPELRRPHQPPGYLGLILRC